ncbi:MAG: carboxypeptidase regulatory-like domain-containing protein, partial [Acidobacteria bacterium]|nr:carboxypeptidase regulatory-like domain-containing protein [Acidobacteriota bacterium]
MMMKGRISFRFTLGLATFIFCASNALAQSGSTIQGFVYSGQRTPVERARVEITDEVNTVLQGVFTDANGRFVFRGLSSGRFTVNVKSYGSDLEPQSKEVQIAGFGAIGQKLSDSVQIDFYLKRRNASSNDETVNGVVFAQDVPENAKEMYKNALSELEKKRSDEGIKQLQDAIRAFPNYFIALDRLGYEYLRLEKFSESLDYFARAVTVNSKSYNSWYGYGYSNFSLGNWENAVGNLQNAVAINQNSM